MHSILVGLAVIGLLSLAAIGVYVYYKRRQIAQFEKDSAEQLRDIASKL
jgi:LPXTG-motif cell wall-anchored protein